MKELIVHADSVSYEVTKKTRLAEEISDEMKEGKMEDVLWVRIAVEKSDEGNIDSLVKKAVADIEEVAGQVKAKNVMLYPYAHLLMGSKPSNPEAAIELSRKWRRSLKEKALR
jgi:threonyl-tRNA synthetase